MDDKEIYRIIENNKNVPFIKKIIKGILDQNLSVSEKNGMFIVYPGQLKEALKNNDFIEFNSKEAADWFIANYREYNKEKIPEEMNQEQFEEWRTKKTVKFKYSGTVERIA